MIREIFSASLPVDETYSIRGNRFIGHGGGKRFSIVSGTHGDELEGQMVCYLVARRILAQSECLYGQVDIYPALNPLGIDTIQRGVPNFDIDMNRTFPGDANGTMIEQASYAITEDLMGSSMVIDIHSSNLYLRETPQVRINVLHERRLVPPSLLLGVDFVWVHDAATVLESTLAYSLNSTGTPCLVVEMGVGQRINHKMCGRLTSGIFSLMSAMGMWKSVDGEVFHPRPIVCKGDSVVFLNAETSGVFLTELKCGIVVAKDEVIGEIVNPLSGEVLSRVTSPVEGYLFTIRAYPIVYEGSLMARIYKMK